MTFVIEFLVPITFQPKYRAATKLQEVNIQPPGPYDMIIKNHAVGINASDVNFTAGAYLPGVRQGLELTKIQ